MVTTVFTRVSLLALHVTTTKLHKCRCQAMVELFMIHVCYVTNPTNSINSWHLTYRASARRRPCHNTGSGNWRNLNIEHSTSGPEHSYRIMLNGMKNVQGHKTVYYVNSVLRLPFEMKEVVVKNKYSYIYCDECKNNKAIAMLCRKSPPSENIYFIENRVSMYNINQ